MDAPLPLPKVSKQLIVFDFDWSLADQDSDRWVHEALCPRLRKKLKQLKPTIQFTDLCAMLLRELHDVEGKSQKDVEEVMRQIPFVSRPTALVPRQAAVDPLQTLCSLAHSTRQ